MSRKIIRTVLIAIPVALAAVLIFGAIAIHTGAFRNFLLSQIREQVFQHTGARIDIGALQTRWLPLEFELDDITVHGKENRLPRETALAHARDLKVSILFAPLLRGKLQLRDLVLEEPVVHVRIDAQGDSNLPVPPRPSSGDTTAKVFDLEVRNGAIHSGEIYYNDLQLPLNAELHDLKFQVGYTVSTGKYQGSLAYDRGLLATSGIEPIAHAVHVQFSADREGLSLNPLVLATGNSSLTIDARLQNYAAPAINGSYSGSLLTDDVARVLHLTELPVGKVAVAGSVAYHAAQNAPALAGLSLQGLAQSARLSLATNWRPLDFTAVGANYELRDADLHVSDFSAGVLGGRARGNFEIANLSSRQPKSRVDASLAGISLTLASNTLAPRDVRRIPLVGTANAQFRAGWTGSIDNLVAQMRLAISSPQHPNDQGGSIPVNGMIQAHYDAVNDVLSFDQSHVQTSRTKIQISGMLSPRRSGNSNISALVTAGDLHEVTTLADLVANAVPHGTGASIPELGGSGSLRASVTGTVRSPRLEGQLTAQNLSVDGSRWNTLSAKLSAQPSKVSIENGNLSALRGGEISFSGSAGLRAWTLAPESPISARVKAANLSVADVERIARLEYPVTGLLSANVSLKGTRQNPQANGTLTLKRATAWNEPIDDLALNATTSDGTIRSTLTLQAPAGTVSASGTYRLADQQYRFSLHGAGLQLAKVAALQRAAPLQGTLNISAGGAGTIHDPQLQASLTAPQLIIQDQTISGLSAQVNLAHQNATFAVHSTVYQGAVDAKGTLNLTSTRNVNATLDVRNLPLAPVLASFVHASDASKITGETDVHASVSGPMGNLSQITAHLEIPALSLSYEKAHLALAQPLIADYRDGALSLKPARIEGTGTNLTFGGTIPIRGAAAYSLTADGSVDLGVVQQFVPDVRSSGQVLVHVSSSGPSASGMRGELLLKDAIFSSDSIPVGIEGVNARINFSGSRADIADCSGTAGGGSVSLTGFVTYGHETNFNLALNARSVRIRHPEGLRSVLSGQLYAQGNPSGSTLTGRVQVDRLSFTQAFDLANFAGFFSETSAGSTPSLFERRMKLNVALQSAQDLDLASSKLSIGGSANTMVIGTLAEPVILGRVALTSGEVFFLGKRFEVQSGTIQFANPTRTVPVLNLHVTTTIEQYNVTLTLSGPVERLKTTYTSTPALPPADIIHLLAFGNTTEEAAAAPSSSVATSAESVLAQGVSGRVAGRLENLTGLSQLTIDPLAANSQGDPGAQVAIQERVTGSLLLTFSTDVTSTQSQTVEVQYQLNKRLSVTVLRDQNGGYGIDLRLHKEF